MEMSTPRALSDLLEGMKTDFTDEKISVSAIMEAFHERGFGILLFIFTLPAAVPIPMPGINTLIAIPLIVLTWQQTVGRHTVWMPEKVLKGHIDQGLFQKILDMTIPWVLRLEWFIKPRMGHMTEGRISHLIGFTGLIMAVCGALPLPFVNTAPAIGIAIMAIGVLMRDGLAVLVGMIFGLSWVIGVLTLYAIFGMKALDIMKDFFLSWLA